MKTVRKCNDEIYQLAKERSCTPFLSSYYGTLVRGCNWRQHLQRLSPHGLHWLTVDEGLDTAALTRLQKRSSCPWVNTLCRPGTHWMTLVDPKLISLTTIQVGKRIKDIKKESFLIRELQTNLIWKIVTWPSVIVT
jgi:hypothetical protein